jgi:hypothetical protein
VTAAWIFKLFGRMKRGVIHYDGRAFGYRFDELRPDHSTNEALVVFPE